MRQWYRIGVVAALAVAVVATGRLSGQAAAQLGGGPLNHVGVVVRDAEAATKHFADVMGITPPKVMSVQLALTDNSKVDIRYATVQLPNLLIEFEQPVSPRGPLFDHLQTVGQSLHHVGFAVTDGVDEKRAFLQQQGGRWVAGPAGAGYAFVELRDRLGATIEIVKATYPAANAPAAVDPATPAPLGSRAFSHVGIAVANTDAVAKAWSDILGVPAPTVRDYKDAQYPPGHAWSLESFIRLTSWRQANIGVELLGAVGRTNPWSDSVERFKGSNLQHLALPVGDRMAETIAELQKKGGKWTNGKPGGGYAYLDFTDQFGITFELNGTPAK